MSFIAGGKQVQPQASNRKTGKGSRGKQRAPRSRASDMLRKEIASCEARILDVKEAEMTLKALKVALAALGEK